MSYCQKCGNPVGENTGFCPNCGAPVSAPKPKVRPVHKQPYQGPAEPNPYQYQQTQGQAQYNYGNQGAPQERKMELLDACKMFFQRYTDFEGRSRRSEFWWAYLMVFVGSCIPFLGWLFSIACLIPMIAVGVRRLHDIGKSGWYYLLYLVPIVGTVLMILWGCEDTHRGANEYGPDPKYL